MNKVIKICGEFPENFNKIVFENNPNFVFENDPNFVFNPSHQFPKWTLSYNTIQHEN